MTEKIFSPVDILIFVVFVFSMVDPPLPKACIGQLFAELVRQHQ